MAINLVCMHVSRHNPPQACSLHHHIILLLVLGRIPLSYFLQTTNAVDPYTPSSHMIIRQRVQHVYT
jgi:hypothetical protein